MGYLRDEARRRLIEILEGTGPEEASHFVNALEKLIAIMVREQLDPEAED